MAAAAAAAITADRSLLLGSASPLPLRHCQAARHHHHHL